MKQVASPTDAEAVMGDDLPGLATANARPPEASAQVFAAADVDASSIGLCLVDERGHVLAANDAYRDVFAAAVPPTQLAAEVQRRLAGGPPSPCLPDATADCRFDRLDGPSGAMILVTIRHRDANPPVPHLDALTRLPDRSAIAERAAAWRRASSGPRPRFAALFLDLNDFKGVNDRHGHAVGDIVLQQLAARWLECVRDGDLVARYGGDEFVLLIKGAATPEEVDPVIRRLRDATRQPVVVEHLSLFVDAAVGWAAPSDAAWTIDALVAAADRDMYARKGRVLR